MLFTILSIVFMNTHALPLAKVLKTLLLVLLRILVCFEPINLLTPEVSEQPMQR